MNKELNQEFFEALAMLEKEKGIPMQYLIEKIEAAIEGVQVNVIKLVSVVGVHTGRGCQALQYFCPLSEE